MPEYQPGDRVRLTADIWDDGQDHHPASYVARIGDVVTVNEISGARLLCAHDWVTDHRRFVAFPEEIEKEGRNG